MGCSQSTDSLEEAQKAELDKIQEEINDAKSKGSEQQNLLRYKVEVLVNMLAMEEKKSDALTKRLETIKYLMLQHGTGSSTDSLKGLISGKSKSLRLSFFRPSYIKYEGNS